MPGPIFYPTKELANRGYAGVTISARTLAPADPMNLAAYGPARPHVDGKMAPPEKHAYPDVWAGKRKKR